MTDRHQLTASEAFALLDRTPVRELPLPAALNRIADVTSRAVPGVHEASITLLGPGGARTAAFTGETALELDEWQYDHRHGPCLAASAAYITVHAPDLAGDTRWPAWSDRALAAGIHSALSMGLPLRHSMTGSLNLYATHACAFDDAAVLLAETLAGYIAIAMDVPRPVSAHG